MIPLAVWVPGDPVQQGSKTAFVVKGRAVMTDANSKKLKPWRKHVTALASAARPEAPIDEPVSVELRFVMRRPKSVKRRLPSVQPDLDKLVRAVLDSLTDAAVFKDDALVVDLVASKIYGEYPGVEIIVRLA